MLNLLMSVVLSFSLIHEQEIEIDPNKPLGDVVPIEEAISNFEELYDSKVLSPKYLPFEPTVSGGYVDKTEKKIRIDYLNEKDNKTLSVNAHVDDITFDQDGEDLKLKNGQRAKILNDKSIGFIFVYFKSNGLTYLVGINRSKYPNDEVCIEELTKVVNSMN
ncbi:hypothetical protein [Bacillus suaedae]|uniref:DUF4367 domain-containing protein n=1 Tax=Halalkalibacter suaedae TaxID=2822140 RepID=A0A940WTX6_9BACI|nr:hypothetical protein [Bacillus suaedae]MBP3950377.1 hypothetical protein [Bacillus suaedae]